MAKIKKIKQEEKINKSSLSNIDYPVFCFKHLQDCSIKDCKNADFFKKFLFRLKKLCDLGWKEIRQSDRHSYGAERINIDQVNPTKKPSILTPDVEKLIVFRATGDNHAFLGIKKEPVFHVIYIEAEFGEIYRH